MANLKEVRNRIASVESTRKITSAMKLVSASKLRRFQSAILKVRPYSEKLNEVLQTLSSAVNTDSLVYAAKREPEHVVLVVLASNKGLCGGFNSAVIKKTESLIAEKYEQQLQKGNLQLITFGKRVTDYFSRKYTVQSFDELTENPTAENIYPIAERLLNDFAEEKIDKIELVYNQFKNSANQILVAEQFLPIETLGTRDEDNFVTDYIFEPNQKSIIETMVPKILKLQFYKAILDSAASEHGARMTAMHKATDNATELLADLRLMYNKARQAAITNEIVEIVSGAAAMD